MEKKKKKKCSKRIEEALNKQKAITSAKHKLNLEKATNAARRPLLESLADLAKKLKRTEDSYGGLGQKFKALERENRKLNYLKTLEDGRNN